MEDDIGGQVLDFTDAYLRRMIREFELLGRGDLAKVVEGVLASHRSGEAFIMFDKGLPMAIPLTVPESGSEVTKK
tara:strand:+ start:72 stop:296 length:225 start_codon:yes stop_codon:yes gene_type:complete